MDEGSGGFGMGAIQMKAVPSPTAEKVTVAVSEDRKYLDKDGVAESSKGMSNCCAQSLFAPVKSKFKCIHTIPPLHFACDLHAYPKYRLQLEDDLFYVQQTLVGARND
jgi:hypothetical protein